MGPKLLDLIFLSFAFMSFELVSYFVLRISDLQAAFVFLPAYMGLSEVYRSAGGGFTPATGGPRAAADKRLTEI